MRAVVQVEVVESHRTRTGKTRYVVRDADGREYTTFRPQIGQEASRFEGRRAEVEFHEEERGQYRNVYLDAIADAPDSERGDAAGADVDETAWSTAVEAAPWLLGTRQPEEEVAPDELYEKLEPFKRRVAEDIRENE
jgi:hypothetical protein